MNSNSYNSSNGDSSYLSKSFSSFSSACHFCIKYLINNTNAIIISNGPHPYAADAVDKKNERAVSLLKCPSDSTQELTLRIHIAIDVNGVCTW